MSKLTATREWVFALSILSLLFIVSFALLAFFPAGHGATGAASAAKVALTPAARSRIQASYAALPLAFEKNQGQIDPQVRYTARGDRYTLFLTARDAVFSLRSTSASSNRSPANLPALGGKSFTAERKSRHASSAVVRMQLAGGNSSPTTIEASDKLSGTANYFLGNDPGKWQKNVPRYGRVSYKSVYPGVDMAFHGAQRQVEFDFLVSPGANPQPIAFHFTGNDGMKTDESGNLIISSSAGTLLLHKPLAYQEQNGDRHAVDAAFVLKANHEVGFELGNYDHSRELVIDPSVSYAYSTYLGGSAEDDGFAIAADSNGNAYVTGKTMSSDFPTVGGLSSNSNTTGTFDVFVTKIAADGTSLVYSTYIGGGSTGKGNDNGNSIAVDSSGDAFVAGGTASSDFPISAGAFQPTLHGTSNAFVAELNPAGNSLTYSTYLGGTGSDTAFGVAVDGSGNVYTVGVTSSSDFPLSTNPLQKTVAGGFVSKLTPAGKGSSDLVFSTYIGGGLSDFPKAVALDSSANAYVTGQTFGSLVIEPTSGAVQPTFGGGVVPDAFVAAIKADGSNYIYSTYLGGSDIDIGTGIAVDTSGNAYVTGYTASTATSAVPFPLSNALYATFGGGQYDAFVAKVNSTGTFPLVYSTYLGGTAADYGEAIAVDGSGNAYVNGSTFSATGFPLSSNAAQATFAGTSDAFVSELNSAGSVLVFSTYLGGTGDQDAAATGGIAVDKAGTFVYVTGSTTATDFPTLVPEQKAAGGGGDAFVVKYAQGSAFSLVATTPAAVSAGTSATSTVKLTGYNGYNSGVNLKCSVSGTGSPAPACSASSFAKNPLTPAASPGATTMLTITTTAATAQAFSLRKFFYAMWVPVAGMSLAGFGFSSRRKKALGLLMIVLAVAAILLMPACGGGSSSSPGPGGGSGGTPAGAYTVTITGTGTDAAAITQTTQVTVTVN